MQTKLILLLSSLLLIAAAPSSNISYEVRGFGSSNVVVIFSGEGVSTLTVAPNAEGTSFRVSGVGAVFSRKGEELNLPLFSSVNQVKRGASTDLIVNLSAPSEINATPSAGALQISIAKNYEAIVASPTPTVESKPLSPDQELVKLRAENDRLKKELVDLKALLLEKDRAFQRE